MNHTISILFYIFWALVVEGIQVAFSCSLEYIAAIIPSQGHFMESVHNYQKIQSKVHPSFNKT